MRFFLFYIYKICAIEYLKKNARNKTENIFNLPLRASSHIHFYMLIMRYISNVFYDIYIELNRAIFIFKIRKKIKK
jgi:hypothetical protein